jgi:hypothetical protein
MLTAEDGAGNYRIPKIIVSDAYSSETVAFADLVLPDTTYLERHDCISLLDRPISEPDAAGDAIRWPVVAPERPGHAGVRPFQSVLLDLGARLGLPGMVTGDGMPAFRDYADYMTRHERRPGVGPLAGWRGDGSETWPRRAQPRPDRALHREWRLLAGACPAGGRLFQAVQPRLPGLGGGDGPDRQRPALSIPALFRAAGRLPRRGAPARAGSRPSTCATGS